MKQSILYIDDEHENLRAFKSVFRREYNIHITDSAKDGLKYLEDNQVDLIITDQRMPEMTGVEFLREVFDKFPSIPPTRIMLSGYSQSKDVEMARKEFGLAKFISKPWDPDELRENIESLLNTNLN